MYRHKMTNDEFKEKAELSKQSFTEALSSIDKLTTLETRMLNGNDKGEVSVGKKYQALKLSLLFNSAYLHEALH